MKTIAVYIFALAALLSLVQCAMHLQTDADTFSVITDTMVIETWGNANRPAFKIFAVGANETTSDKNTYKFSLDAMCETAADVDGQFTTCLSGTTVNLAKFDWTFSTPVVTDTTIDFNITSAAQSYTPPFTALQFNVHVNAARAQEVKFDILINGYTWTNPDASLDIAYKMVSKKTIKKASHEGNVGDFDECSFDSSVSAVNGTALIRTQASFNGSDIHLTYGHFAGDMIHDPVIAMTEESGAASIAMGLLMIALFLAMLL